MASRTAPTEPDTDRAPILDPDEFNQLQRERESAERTARMAAARMEAHTSADALRRHDRGLAWDRALAAAAPDELERIKAAAADRIAFREAALAEPFVAAWIERRAARWRQANLARDAMNAHDRAGLGGRPPHEIDAFRGPDLLDDLRAAADAEAERVGGLESDERMAAREAYATGDSDTLPGAP